MPYSKARLPSIPHANQPRHPQDGSVVSPGLTSSAPGAGIFGFASAVRAGRGDRPNRVRHPPGYWFTSGCVLPIPAETRLPSVEGVQTMPRQDFHPADSMRSGAHCCGSVRPGAPPAGCSECGYHKSLLPSGNHPSVSSTSRLTSVRICLGAFSKYSRARRAGSPSSPFR